MIAMTPGHAGGLLLMAGTITLFFAWWLEKHPALAAIAIGTFILALGAIAGWAWS